MIHRLTRSSRCLRMAPLIIATTLASTGTASAFRSIRFTVNSVSLVTDDGAEMRYTPRSFADKEVTGFSGFSVSQDHRYVGWQTEEAVIPNATPIALGLVIVGPHSKLEIGSGQQIHGWHFLLQRRVRVCAGPTHGGGSDTCVTYALPE